MMIMNICP